MPFKDSVNRLTQDQLQEAFKKAQGEKADFLLLTSSTDGNRLGADGAVEFKEEAIPVRLANLEQDLIGIFGRKGCYNITAVYDLGKDFQNARASQDALPPDVLASANCKIQYLNDVAAYVREPWYKRCLRTEPSAPT